MDIDFPTPSILKPEFKEVKKSPIAAEKLKRRSITPDTPPPLNIPPTAFATSVNNFLNISKEENKPLNVRFILSEVEDIILAFAVKFLNPSDNLKICSDMLYGKISLKASFIGLKRDDPIRPKFLMISTKLLRVLKLYVKSKFLTKLVAASAIFVTEFTNKSAKGPILFFTSLSLSLNALKNLTIGPF